MSASSDATKFCQTTSRDNGETDAITAAGLSVRLVRLLWLICGIRQWFGVYFTAELEAAYIKVPESIKANFIHDGSKSHWPALSGCRLSSPCSVKRFDGHWGHSSLGSSVRRM